METVPTAFVYDTTPPCAVATFAPDAFADWPLGYAYEAASGHFVHTFGRDGGTWTLHLTQFAERPNVGKPLHEWKSLDDWELATFGGSNPRRAQNDVGTVTRAVWRPGLYYLSEIYQALETNEVEQRATEQALLLLVERLDELFLYVEPEGTGLQAYGPRTRELLILACTEVENAWAGYMRLAGVAPSRQGYTTNDYVRLSTPLFLDEFEVALRPYTQVPTIRPFQGWDSRQPTPILAVVRRVQQSEA